MSSVSIRVLELLEQKQINFDDAEKILNAISFSSKISVSLHQKEDEQVESEVSYLPQLSSYMHPNTLEKLI